MGRQKTQNHQHKTEDKEHQGMDEAQLQNSIMLQ